MDGLYITNWLLISIAVMIYNLTPKEKKDRTWYKIIVGGYVFLTTLQIITS